MMDPEGVKELLQPSFPNATIEVIDQTGTFDHFGVYVESPEFNGKPLVQQHRMVQKALQDALSDGRIHAVQIKTAVPK